MHLTCHANPTEKKVFLLGVWSLVYGCVGLARGGVSYLMLMLLPDLTVELQQLNELGKHLRHAVPGRESLNGPLAEVMAEILPLIHEQEHHGQDSVPTEVRSKIPGQGLGDDLSQWLSGSNH